MLDNEHWTMNAGQWTLDNERWTPQTERLSVMKSQTCNPHSKSTDPEEWVCWQRCCGIRWCWKVKEGAKQNCSLAWKCRQCANISICRLRKVVLLKFILPKIFFFSFFFALNWCSSWHRIIGWLLTKEQQNKIGMWHTTCEKNKIIQALMKTSDFRINQNLAPRNTSCIEHVERHRAGHIGSEDRCGLNGKTTQKDA